MFRILDIHIYFFMTFTWLDVQFSLPLPQGGRDAVTKNLILREDQLPHRVLYPKTKKKTGKQVVCISVYLTTDVSNRLMSHGNVVFFHFCPPVKLISY